MDQKLKKSTQNDHKDRTQHRYQSNDPLGLAHRSLAFWILCAVIMVAGCQNAQLWNQSALPVPPQILDDEALENVRFQSQNRGLTGGRPGSTGPEPPGGRSVREKSDILPDFQQLADSNPEARPDIIKDVQITGNQSLPTHHLTRNIRTRPGRYFDPDKLQQDVNSLWRMPEIARVKGPYVDRQPDGVVIRIEVIERNRLTKVEYIGNRGISDRALAKQTGLENGSPLDVHQIRNAKTKIEEHYREKGYPRTQVEVLDGNNNDDSKVTFLIHEDQQQRIWKVNFEGNTIASEARLRHIVKSKPGYFKYFGGLAQRNLIDQDVDRVTEYYRSLGYFNAQVGREISESNDGRWLNVRFIVNEGPRYKVREVKFIGNKSYEESELKKLLQLNPSGEMPVFDSTQLNEDLTEVRDLYGSQGYVFSNVSVETRFLEEPGMLDLVYKVKEGKQYRVGQINVHYEGGNSVTKRQVVLNRMTLKPGDLIDVRQIEKSKTKLAGSQIFAAGQPGAAAGPTIVVKPPELKRLEQLAGPDGAKGIGGSTSRSANRNSGGSGSRSGGSGFR
jgi:outer membrane protein insertion porin family